MIDYRRPKDHVALQDLGGNTALCPLCEEPATTEIVDTEFTHGDLILKVTLPVRCCTDCDIEFMDHVGARIKDEAVYRAHDLLSPWQIREIRERWGLSRSAFAELTGWGKATIKRWETGAIAQNRANDRYLRLLDTAFGWAALKRLAQEQTLGGGTAVEPEGVRFPHMSNRQSLSDRASRFRVAA